MTDKKKNTKWILQEGTLTMFVSEIIGTAVLIFIGCMGCIGTMGPTPPPPMQTALTFGLTVNTIIMMLGHISGAHLNPAVTIGAVIVGLKSIPTGAIYIVAQFCGATAGYGLLKLVTPSELFSDGNFNSTVPLCVTAIHPDVTKVQAILIEAFCTGIILCTACATWDPRCAHTTDSTAIRFGLAVAGISFAASPFTGCSMNPARTFGPALWNGAWTDQWVYWIGPVLGALLGTYTYQVFFHEPRKENQEYNLPINSLELSTIDIQDTKS
ncbi:hypothetical protein PV325_000670 [Microctonus aethiopoides]|nr:hypothetical protein PV325_000670 [Microctonus aethiopoides]